MPQLTLSNRVNYRTIGKLKRARQELWDSVYATENENHDDMGDEGECWFGEEAMYRMIRKLEVGLKKKIKINFK